ncbi:MAG TPA: formate dehydrogenase accessory sulfurtransferase FdhD [Rhodanobacteraceae bacterium]|nr:formate dehydrogenase accessory sulfurtransferase FdhD [Rhodanobacteraceae bacterium]
MTATPPRTASDADSTGFRDLGVLRVGADGRARLTDKVIAEAPVALVYNGVSFAVMMATPCDLPDFGLGFALAEGIVEDPGEFELLDVLKAKRGVTLQGLIPPQRFEALQQRRRSLAGRSGCGLCGVEALEDAVRPLPRVTRDTRMDRDMIVGGMRTLAQSQALNALTGGAHAAAFVAAGQPATVREDVGRHNALDKLIGALAVSAGRRDALLARTATGFTAITSRASWEMVHKAAHAGIPVIAAISAPTSLAIEAADSAGITLIAFARDEAMNIYTHAARIT